MNRSENASPESAVAETEARYRTLFEHAPDAIVVFDVDAGYFVDANENAARLFGYTRDELLSLSPIDVSPEFQPDGRRSADIVPRMIGLALGDEPPAFEWTHIDRAGNPVDCEIRLVRMPPLSRRLIRASMTDISERKATSAALARREREFRSLAENSPDWIVRIDRELRRTYVNPAVAAASSTPVEQLLGKRPTESFPDSPEMKAWEDGLRKCFETGNPQVLERETNLGQPRTLQTSIVPEFNEHGELETVLSVTRDVTSVRRALEAEFRLASIVESAEDAVVSSDLEGLITSWNGGAERLFGYTAAEVVGGTTAFLFVGSAASERMAVRRRVLGGETVTNYVREWRTKSGAEVTASMTIFPLRGPNGEVIGIASIAHDLTDELRAARALALSEARLRVAFETAHMGTWLYDRSSDRMEWSPQAAEIYQRDVADMPRTMRESVALFHPDDSAVLVERLREGIAEGAMPRDYRIRIPSGEYRWISGIGDVVTDPETAVVSGIIVDIHERKLAEQALRESEARFRAVVESAAVGILIFDGAAVLSANPAAGAIFGVDAKRLTEPGFLASLTDAETAQAVRARAAARARGEDVPPAYDAVARKVTGETIYLHMNANTIELDGQRVALITVVDMTERRLAENALRESEARFRNLVDNSPDFITRIDREFRHEFVNLPAERDAGLTPERVIGKRPDEIGFPPEIGALWMARHMQVRESGERVEFEYALDDPRHPGAKLYRRARLIPEFGDDGTVQHILSLVTDITAERSAAEERRLLDEQMQHAQKLESLGILAGGIAHDFNNLLVAILGNAGLALMELPPESPARQTVQAIETAAQRAADLTRQMLAYSGQGRFVIEPLSLSRVVEEMAHLLEVSVSKRAILKYRFAPGLPIIEGDATQIRQVVMNLIINASDAIGDHSGVISVATGMLQADSAYLAGAYIDGDLPPGDYVFLEVADTGAGMDEETRKRIFDPFFTTKFTGRGLGLAAVLGIVRGHGGTIKLYSEPGRGTTFKVLFPAGAGEPDPAPAPTGAPATGALDGRRALIVDDDETVRAVTRRILERAGMDVLLAVDGADGLRVYAANPGIDAVLLDMTMPRMDGEEAFRELRRLDPAVRVILTSGYNEQDATERFAGKGLAGFIQKPYRPSDLLEKIEQALAQDVGGQSGPSSASSAG